MATLLRRLSVQLDKRREAVAPPASPLAASSSFNDFSMHIQAEVEREMDVAIAPGASQMGPGNGNSVASKEALGAGPVGSSSPFVVGSAPPGFSGLAPPRSPALKIPRTSVAHLLSQASGLGTPRNSVDAGAAPSIGGTAPSPRASLEDPGSPRTPRSPRSPLTPGGRRRKEGKIDGMDYYEFCELIRSSSL
eukprot:scaffold24.g2981.t1